MPSCILVVDDDPQICQLFTRLLRAAGYSVASANTGTQAIRTLQSGPIDLVVLDLSMPRPDGFELLKMLRAERPGLRVLVVSGFMQGALLEAAELVGATATLGKTDAPKLLVETVKSLLRR